MKKVFTNKATKIYDELKDLIQQLEDEITDIEENAYDRDRDLTESEEDKISEIEYMLEALENSLDYLVDYVN